MAYVSNMADDEQKNPAQGAVPPSGGAGVQLAPSSGVGNAGASVAQPGQPGAGGSFATLDKYLTANQGQAEPLANKITQGIGQQYNALDAQNNATIAGLNQQVTSAPGYTASDPTVLANEAANPVSFAGDQGNVKQFQSLLNNTYSGPLNAEGTTDYTKQQNAVNNAIATGQQQTTTEAGRKQLLEQNEAAPSTSVTGLNSAILSQDPNAQAKVENAYKPFSSLLTNLQGGAQDVDKTIAKEQADAAASSKAANDAISSQIAALNAGVTGKVSTAQQAEDFNRAEVQKAFQTGIASPTALQTLGLTPDQFSQLTQAQYDVRNPGYMTARNYGVQATGQNMDLGTWFAPSSSNISAANVATPEDYAKAQAFQTLINGLNLSTPMPVIAPTTSVQAGTASTIPGTYDFATALQTLKDQAAQEKGSAQNLANYGSYGLDKQHADAQGGPFNWGSIAPWVANPALQLGNATISGGKKAAGKI